MLERMDEFFQNRIEGYDEHMLTNIAGAAEFYPFTAQQLPTEPGCRVLDLGCGTGLELEEYFKRNPTARVTGIDLAPAMLVALQEKFGSDRVKTICADYFQADLGLAQYHAAVSVESLHHFPQAQKRDLYQNLHRALKPGGYFILTDYFAATDEEESRYFTELTHLKSQQNLPDNTFYHYDTPLTVAHETQALLSAGFTTVTILRSWGATSVIRAEK